MRRLLASFAVLLALTGSAAAADCWGNATGTQANCGAVQMFNNPSGQSVPVTAAVPLPVTIISGGSGGGAMTVADGADVTQGALADAAATAGGTGSLSAKLRLLTTQFDTNNTALGAVTETAPATDTASSGLNGRLQRIAQRLTSLIAALGTPMQTTGGTVGLVAGVAEIGNVKNSGTFGVQLNATPTVAAGNGVVPAPSSEALAGIVPVISSALESNHVICAAACNFYGGYITTGATAGWLLLANATSAPTAGGAAIAPIACVLAPANQSTSIGGAGVPIRGSTGIVMVFSTSGCLTNTASTTAFLSGQAK